MSFKIVIITAISFIVLSCSNHVDTSKAISLGTTPAIFPDYTNVTIPNNIAPLNFSISEKGSDYRAVIKPEIGKELLIKSKKGIIKFPMKKWKKMLAQNKGKSLIITVLVKDESKQWKKFEPFALEVSPHEIDSHLAYRLINVGYILWKKLGLYQRDLTTFKQKPIMVNRNTNGNCMNCHSFSQNNPETMLFHMRGDFSGTIISENNDITKLNTKTPYTMAAGAYPSWHPNGKHIAMSVNLINQWFHGVDKRNEVYDKASDIVVYDIDKNMITTSPVVSTKNRENLPCWSADGKHIYFCSSIPITDTIAWEDMKYDLMRVSFDVETNTWGEVEPVLLASEIGGTISFPKTSPDGEWLLFTKASHGYFTIFNETSDLYMLNLRTNEYFPFPYNTQEVESFHSWSSNGKWFVFSSKSIDGLCTRPFFAYFDNGKFSKPFVLPQKDPLFYKSFKDNYNVPELITGEVKLNKRELLKTARGKAKPVQFDPNVNVDGLSGASKIDETTLH